MATGSTSRKTAQKKPSGFEAVKGPLKVQDASPSEGDPRNPKDIAALTRVPLHLLPAVGRIHGAMACRDGLKYGPYNWRAKPISLMEYTAAMERHLLSIRDGEDYDPKSGVSHLGHLIATASIILDAESVGMLIDDRPTRSGTAPVLIRNLNEAMAK